MNYYLLATLMVFINIVVLYSLRLYDEPKYYLGANAQVAQPDSSGTVIENRSGTVIENRSGTVSREDPLVSNYCQHYWDCS